MGLFFFFSSRRRHTRCALVTGVQTCALPICLALDLKKPAAKEALWRLIDGADAIVHNMRPQKMAALGFGPDAVLARQPGIVYGGLHGYREDGPYAERPAYDDVIQGESGFARSEEHTSELQSLMRISHAVFCLKNKKYM